MSQSDQAEIAQFTADIVSAFVANNRIEQTELSKLIETVRRRSARDYQSAAHRQCLSRGRTRFGDKSVSKGYARGRLRVREGG